MENMNYLLQASNMIEAALESTTTKELQTLKNENPEHIAYCFADMLNNTLNHNIPLAGSTCNLGRSLIFRHEKSDETEKEMMIRRWRIGWFIINIFLKEDIIRLTKDWKDPRAAWMLLSDYETYQTEDGKSIRIYTNEFVEGLLSTYNDGELEIFYYKDPITHDKQVKYSKFINPLHGELIHNSNFNVRDHFTESNTPKVFETINKHIDIKYNINKPLLEILQQCLEDDILTFNNKILNEDQLEGLNRERDEVLYKADKYKDIKYYRQSMFYDNRGRLYPNTVYLNTTGSKLSKSLILLNQKDVIGMRGWFWMLLHASNMYGTKKISKENAGHKDTIDDKVNYAEKSLSAWMEIAENPIKNKLWQRAEEPFGFLAAILEICSALKLENKYEYKSGLMIAFDASCSGLQILSALARDKSSGSLCNLVPSDTKGDYYLTIADEVWKDCTYSETEYALFKQIIEDLRSFRGNKDLTREYIDTHVKNIFAVSKVYYAQPEIYEERRKICKRGGMTYFYSCSGKTMGKQIFNDFSTDPIFIDLNIIFAKWMGTKIYYACRKLMPGPTALMKAFIAMGTKDYKEGKDFTLLAPYNNFKLLHRYRDSETEPMKVTYKGKRIQVRITIGKNEKLAYKKIQSATSPNVVHMLDSQIVSYLVNNCEYPVVCVHDSFSTNPAHAGYLYEDTRAAMKFLFDSDVLLNLLKQKGMEHLHEELVVGDLDISKLDENEWCFI